MGVNLSSILIKHETSLKDNSGSIVSVDAYNIIYQFLSSIRGDDGEPLKDSNGNITSHLSGIFYRTSNLLENNIKPVYVFDGKPFHLKSETLRERSLIKEKNIMKLEEAIASNDDAKIRSLSSRINYITDDIVNESKTLLNLMGLPYVQAPSEGEAQASYMTLKGDVNAVVSQDYDCLLFGAKRILRNFTVYGRRRIAGTSRTINVNPEIIDLNENLSNLGISREQLIYIGILTGTDFNPGVKGIGAKTALSLIKKYNDIYSVIKIKNIGIDNLDEIIEFFMNPPHNDYEIKFNEPDFDGIIDFLCGKHNFSESRVNETLEKISRNYKKDHQSSLDRFF
ncbi:flap endonuclease-1 [Picrophilus oshimae]|uniref:Flap endonuclease 1 n=2 Tax=Picrophilus torridus (strain ATCC 700027 / DSM 9790 / JCM 10055 / NBRC 100828 / KAW 2/3) TaxID=1122961 RepID=FEN_PICTO|nr:flap endonuclease-1 [Picrophilus oshimae]Q6L2I9.1 RecName: Full=Flap endonuclease 1; Short=FEN-1; AltName: Full=Flap structure-specific endonuclease 1 [Picrophilus oshimae DSM 9789]AAT42813.1 RAD-2/FEN-1 exonuclease [Picrophilus oshimae DSM 9789]SMD31574.1 flap endonuclease 1 [Picrophilus oshimae DSM 9789]